MPVSEKNVFQLTRLYLKYRADNEELRGNFNDAGVGQSVGTNRTGFTCVRLSLMINPLWSASLNRVLMRFFCLSATKSDRFMWRWFVSRDSSDKAAGKEKTFLPLFAAQNTYCMSSILPPVSLWPPLLKSFNSNTPPSSIYPPVSVNCKITRKSTSPHQTRTLFKLYLFYLF